MDLLGLCEIREVTGLVEAILVLDEGDALVDWLAPCEVTEITELVAKMPVVED